MYVYSINYPVILYKIYNEIFKPTGFPKQTTRDT